MVHLGVRVVSSRLINWKGVRACMIQAHPAVVSEEAVLASSTFSLICGYAACELFGFVASLILFMPSFLRHGSNSVNQLIFKIFPAQKIKCCVLSSAKMAWQFGTPGEITGCSA